MEYDIITGSNHVRLIEEVMKTKNYILLLALLVTIFSKFSMQGQGMDALALSEYSGISGGILNPALLTGSKVYMDVNILGGSITGSNDMIYFLPENRTISRILNSELDSAHLYNGDFKYNRTYNYYNNKKNKYLNTNIRILGPSAMVQYEHSAFGISTSVRSVHSSKNVPYEIPIILYEGLGYPDFQGVEFEEENYSLVSMTWSEIALSYAFDLINYYDNKFTIGASVKGILGHEAGYYAVRHADYIIQDSKTVEFRDLDADIGYSLPWDETSESLDFSPLVRGFGVGVDLGFVFTKKESIYDHHGYRSLCSRPFQEYKYRIGFSILDIGSVTFKNKGTELYKFEDASAYWAEFDTTHFTGFSNTLKKYSEAFYGDPNHIAAGHKIKIGLPTVVSIQFDSKLKENIYLSAMWKQPIRLNVYTLATPAQIAVTPRYEKRLWGVSMPLSLYNYKEPRVGLALRVYTVTIGTDWLTSLMGVTNFTGMDIYFSMKFNLVKGECHYKNFDW